VEPQEKLCIRNTVRCKKRKEEEEKNVFSIFFLYYVLGKRKPPTPPKPPLLGHLAGPALVIHGDCSKERSAAFCF
jgi:hypothetical protein